MSEQSEGPIEDRIAERAEQENEQRRRLAALQLDGPFDFPRGGGFDPFTALFGTGGMRDRFAVCLRCGSIVVLNDPEERPDGPPVERGVRLHTLWHEEAGR